MRWRVHLRGATCGVALAASLAASGPALGQVPDLPDPDLPLPETPVPVPSLPPVPSVPEVPSVPLPSSPVPSAPVPSAPSAPSTDSAPVVGGSGGGTSGGSTASGGSSTSGGGSAGGATSGAAAQSAAGGSGSRAGSRGRRTRARGDVPSPAAIHRRERRLRRTVRENAACLTALPTAQRRVLELRAGVGPRRPHTRAGTAAILDVRRSTVIQRERAGLKRLRGLDCGGSGGAAPVSGPVARGLALIEAVRQGQSAAMTATSTADGGDGGQTKGTATGKGDIGVKDAVADSGPTDPQPGTIQVPAPPSEGGSVSDAMLLAVIGTLTLLGFGAAAIERRRRGYLL
jgi:hypothetical protein